MIHNKLKTTLRRFPRVRDAVRSIRYIVGAGGILSPLALAWYFSDLWHVRRNGNAKFRSLVLQPCLRDRTRVTAVEPTYFYQDTWAARKIFRANPAAHVDVGSSVMTIGVISQFVPVTMVDIRPIEVMLEGLDFREGSILGLPFDDRSVKSLSSLCVIEHIGLGRYGDSVDAFGSEKAAAELQRVLAAGGDLYVSLPVDGECRLYFNAHRAFTRSYILKMFESVELVDERYQYGMEISLHYDPLKGFGTGHFHFRGREGSLVGSGETTNKG